MLYQQVYTPHDTFSIVSVVASIVMLLSGAINVPISVKRVFVVDTK